MTTIHGGMDPQKRPALIEDLIEWSRSGDWDWDAVRALNLPDDASESRAGVMNSTFPYVWAWGVRPQPSRKGQRCRVLVRGTMNSALVEFEDGARFVTSRNGLRKA